MNEEKICDNPDCPLYLAEDMPLCKICLKNRREEDERED